MTTTINADTSTGGAVISGDASGVLGLQAAGSTQVTINGSGVVLTNPLPVGSGGTGATSLSGITVGTATNATNATNATTSTNLAGGSAGTIPYQSASGTTAMLAAGTSGQVLQSNGAAAPSWVTSNPSAMTLISTQTASSSASLEWTGLSGYNNYMLVFDGLAPSINGRQLYVQVGTTGPAYITSYASNEVASAGNGAISNQYQSAGSSILPVGWVNQIRSTSSVSGSATIHNMTNSLLTNAQGIAVYIDATNNFFSMSMVSGQVGSSTTTKTVIRILFNTGNIASGTASLYGISS